MNEEEGGNTSLHHRVDNLVDLIAPTGLQQVGSEVRDHSENG